MAYQAYKETEADLGAILGWLLTLLSPDGEGLREMDSIKDVELVKFNGTKMSDWLRSSS